MQTNSSNVTFINVAANWQTNPRISVRSVEQLRELLCEASDKDPGIVNLERSENGLLQLGVGGPFACAQFTTPEQRYSSAKAKTIRATADVEFLLGGTPTPIASELCLSFKEALKIAEYFFERGGRDPSFEWVEV